MDLTELHADLDRAEEILDASKIAEGQMRQAMILRAQAIADTVVARTLVLVAEQYLQ